MNWLQKTAQADYPFSKVEYQGRKFETGVPVEFRSLHNREKSPNFGSQFQQDIEPAGRYMIHQENPGDLTNSIWDTEMSKFDNPLVIEFNVDDDVSYNDHSWKAFLSRKFGGLKGKELSLAIAKAGYDGIVTVKKHDGEPVDTSEIVDLRMFHKDDSKPMSLPKYPPAASRWEDEDFGRGVLRIDEVMSPETAEEQFDPGMQYAGHGTFGIVYRTGPGEVSKFSKDPRESETAQLVFDQKYDWIVPMLAPPEQVQYDPPIYRLRMKEMKPPNDHETMLINYIEDRHNRGKETSLDKAMDNFVPYVDVDKVEYIYNRLHYIFQQNEDTLWLTDLHGGNFGWDGNELKVWDIGPGTSS